MSQLLDLIERVVPRIRHYPAWAQTLFAGTFALVLVSFFLWVVVSPAARRNAEHGAIQSSVGLGPAGTVPKHKQALAVSANSGVAATFNIASERTLGRLEAPITYVLDLSSKTIEPTVPYLQLLDSGGPLGGIGEASFSWWYSAATFPKLDVKLANTGKSTVFVTAASIHVENSTPDLEPIPIVLVGGADTPQHFSIMNVGWGRMLQTSLRYGIAASTPTIQATRPSSPPYRANIGGILDQASVDVSNGAAREKLGSHGQATVWGELSYRWRDAHGRPHQQQDQVVTTVYLGPGGVAVGASAPIRGEYHVDLRVSGRNYDVNVPSFDRFIRPQTPDRFEIRVSTARSTIHRGVRVRLTYSDGHSTMSQPYTIRIFEPRDSPST